MITADIQGLNPGAEAMLFHGDGLSIGLGHLRFHGYTKAGSIWWQGFEYSPWPVKAEGFARTGDKPPTPLLTLGNVDGSISALCDEFEDMVGMKITRHRTFVKYLDAINFPGGVNPTASPTEHFPNEVWYIERKTGEDDDNVAFELTSYDLTNVKVPKRQILPNQCSAEYRSADCGYTGPPVATINDIPTSDPLLDNCSRCLRGCKFRYGETGELSFNGFPAAGLMRT